MNAAVTFVALFICCVTLGGATPTPQNDATTSSVTSSGETGTTGNVQGQHEFVSSSHVVSASNGIMVNINEKQVNNKCVSKLSIYGNGIKKTAEYPCGKAPVDIINLKTGLLVGDEWFTDQPKTLVHLSGNQCQKEVFTEQDGKISSTSETLSDEECEKVRSKISELKKEQQKWTEWLAQQQLAVQHQFQQVQQNFQALQNHLFGNLFGGK